MKAQALIDHYNLQRHPEGGWFTETYRSKCEVLAPGFDSKRNCSTAIYFLLRRGEKSHFHRIKSDETWHFYQGDPLEIIEITPKGELIRTQLGFDFQRHELSQYTVKANHWFASHSLGHFSFVGCTVSPGFDFQDFELASYQNLASIYPEHHKLIKEFSLKD